MTEGAGPDARAEEMARGSAILERHQVQTSELGVLAKLPPFRPVLISLMRSFEREDVANDEIAKLVESDPTLSAELLAVVNSPLFTRRITITSPAQAVSVLGFETTKSLAATLGVRCMMQGAPRTPVVRRFWVHSLAAATIAQSFAKLFHVDPHVVYVGALLHDLGRLGLLAGYPDDYTALALASYENSDEILAAEQSRFGMTHCQAGELLADAWCLPAPLRQVADQHHHSASDNAIVALIQLACRLADDLQFQAVHRRDTLKPEESIALYAPPHLQQEMAQRLKDVSAEVLNVIEALDF